MAPNGPEDEKCILDQWPSYPDWPINWNLTFEPPSLKVMRSNVWALVLLCIATYNARQNTLSFLWQTWFKHIANETWKQKMAFVSPFQTVSHSHFFAACLIATTAQCILPVSDCKTQSLNSWLGSCRHVSHTHTSTTLNEGLMQTAQSLKQTSVFSQLEDFPSFDIQSCTTSPKHNESCWTSQTPTVSGRDQIEFRSGSSNEHESACLK